VTFDDRAEIRQSWGSILPALVSYNLRLQKELLLLLTSRRIGFPGQSLSKLFDGFC
jgi:hypothetical protein